MGLAAAARRTARAIAHRSVQRAARALRYELVWPTYYNGIPRTAELEHEFWDRESELPGLTVDREVFRDVLSVLGHHLREFDPPAESAPGSYYAPNQGYDGLDGALLWAIVRHHRPAQVLELGSGHSTLLIREALLANGGDSRHTVIDPFPRAEDLGPVEGYDLQLRSAGDVGTDEFAALQSGDLLFVDTTHTVKVGSEVNHIVLEGFPHLAPGVLVHVHDIFLPHEYPRHFVEDLGYHWAEQYLLQAFLAFNDEFEILLPAHWVAASERELVEAMLRVPVGDPTAFWFRRRER